LLKQDDKLKFKRQKERDFVEFFFFKIWGKIKSKGKKKSGKTYFSTKKYK